MPETWGLGFLLNPSHLNFAKRKVLPQVIEAGPASKELKVNYVPKYTYLFE